MKEIVIYEFLSDAESMELINRLHGNAIKSHRVLMNASTRRTGGLYSVLIREEDFQIVTIIITEYKKQLTIKKNKDQLICPKCKSSPPKTSEKKNASWIKKIFSVGTTVRHCSKCGYEWYI